MIENFFNHIWYSRLGLLSILFLPITVIYAMMVLAKNIIYKVNIFKPYSCSKPVIIIGNISVGGCGKTPFCIWLAKLLKSKNIYVGIISSGYKSKSLKSIFVENDSDPFLVGDEAVLIKNETDAVVVSGGNRVEATKLLINKYNVDIIIHDDGVQHLSLDRDYEILLIDSLRLFGNNLMLPSGPLREPYFIAKNRSDIVIYMNANNNNSESFDKKNYNIYSVNTNVMNTSSGKVYDLNEFSNKTIHIVSGIANIDRIRESLNHFNIKCIIHKYDDHYSFKGMEFKFDDSYPIFLTMKDYVKLKSLKDKNIWILDHNLILDTSLLEKLNYDIEKILNYEN